VSLGPLLRELLGDDLPVAIRGYDGTRLGPPDPPATIVVRSPDALRRVVTAPGELGFARAYVAGDLEVEGDIVAALSLRDRLPVPRLTARQWAEALRLVGRDGLRPLPPPPEELRPHGRRHSKARDADAVRSHYDVSNDFYALFLDESMTYSCAYFERPDATLEEAQRAKHELVTRKLGLEAGMRVLDIGCGWGAFAIHAARTRGCEVVGITLARGQAQLAAKRAAEAGVADRVDIRLQDYRAVLDERFDAVSSVGMFEHVGRRQMETYFERVHGLLEPGGRFLNHAIARPPCRRVLYNRPSFVSRYVFPDGELHEVGAVVTTIQERGFEVRHVETLRDHYGPTLRHWLARLEANWDAAVAEVGVNRARTWRLYLAGSAMGFEAGRLQVHQVLAHR
jgi:cyclopropane-fatty-acyl-phospholipid synthase